MLFVSTVLVKTHKQFIFCDNMELMTFDEFDILISLSRKMFVTDCVRQGEYPFSGIEHHYSNRNRKSLIHLFFFLLFNIISQFHYKLQCYNAKYANIL
jgi:hypothetical protein